MSCAARRRWLPDEPANGQGSQSALQQRLDCEWLERSGLGKMEGQRHLSDNPAIRPFIIGLCQGQTGLSSRGICEGQTELSSTSLQTPVVSSLRFFFEPGGAGTRMIPYGPRSRSPFWLSCSAQIAWFCADRRCHNGSRSGSDHRDLQRGRRIAVEAGSAARLENVGDGGGRLSGRPARLDLHDPG